MTRIRLHDRDLRVTFSEWERWMTRCRELTAPLEHVNRVELLPGWSNELLGWRFGLAITGYLKVGIFTHPSGRRRLVAMRRGLPLLRVTLAHGEFDELLISDAGAPRIAAALTADLAASSDQSAR